MPTTFKMGFEGLVYFNATPGSTAATLLENLTDVAYNLDNETGKTTVRGTSSAPPIGTADVTARNLTIEFTALKHTSDTAIQALLAAIYNGAGFAIRTKDYLAGKGYDGDCTGSVADGQPLNGEQTLKITCTPSRSYGREPNPYI